MSKKETNDADLLKLEQRLQELKPTAQDELAETIISRLIPDNKSGYSKNAAPKLAPSRSFSTILWTGIGSFLAGAAAMFIMMTIFSNPEQAKIDTPEPPEIAQINPVPSITSPGLPQNAGIAVAEVKNDEKTSRLPFLELIEFFDRIRRGSPAELEAFIAEREAMAQRSRLAYSGDTLPFRFRSVDDERPNDFQRQEYLKMLKRETGHFSM